MYGSGDDCGSCGGAPPWLPATEVVTEDRREGDSGIADIVEYGRSSVNGIGVEDGIASCKFGLLGLNSGVSAVIVSILPDPDCGVLPDSTERLDGRCKI